VIANQIQPETELLLLCAAPAKTSVQHERISQLLSGDIDWARLQDLADLHRLTPLLYWELKSISPGAIPSLLAERFEQNMRSNLFLTSQLFRILDLFNREGIPAIPFKGPALAVTAYNNLALRSFCDLDILVRAEDAWRARDVMLREGFHSNLRLNPDRQQAYLASYDELMVYGENEYPMVELHWGFVPPYFSVSLDIARFWQQRTELLLGNRAVPALNHEDLLLVLALHGAKHCWSHFGLICDFAWLLSSQPTPWEIVLKRAREQGIHRMVLLAVLLASRLLGVPLAEPVRRGIAADPPVPVLADKIIGTLFGAGHDERAILRSGLLHMRMRERPWDRLQYFFRLATRPGIEDWQTIDLPAPLRFLYPLLRFPRLVFKYGARRQ
jgi:Uncharacterised nucleotidyltransferase